MYEYKHNNIFEESDQHKNKHAHLLGYTRTLQWKCVESRTDSKRFYYECFILSPLMKGQADTIGIAMQRALLGKIEETYITRVKSEKVPHKYSTVSKKYYSKSSDKYYETYVG
uniref:Uncharacterized protein n=1 Tax=Solanum lycopersicum TaxID=4081 RepID=K4CPF2_SOLLC